MKPLGRSCPPVHIFAGEFERDARRARTLAVEGAVPRGTPSLVLLTGERYQQFEGSRGGRWRGLCLNGKHSRSLLRHRRRLVREHQPCAGGPYDSHSSGAAAPLAPYPSGLPSRITYGLSHFAQTRRLL